MKLIGLDIGTTTISGVLLDTDEGKSIASRTSPNRALLPASHAWENIQNPEVMWEICRQILRQLFDLCPRIDGVGITGQMHGILYLDAAGRAVSPLYTWQDGRGNRPVTAGETACRYLQSATGHPMATGYGLTTHFYNLRNGLVPDGAVTFCTIADYVAMRLCGNRKPLLHASHAAALGLFDLHEMCFDEGAMAKAGIDASILPEVSCEEKIIGTMQGGVPVSIAVGDNQASVLGSVDARSNLLVNIGTGSQLSLVSHRMVAGTSLEYRPYLSGLYLLVGSALCGGRAYQMVRDFFADVLHLFEITPSADIYAKMEEAARSVYADEHSLLVDTRFRGSRSDPGLKGAIEHIGIDNLSPGHLALGVMRGICREMKSFYDEVPQELKGDGACLSGSGNALRRNATLRMILAETFEKEVLIPVHEEEASFGAALLAACLAGGEKDWGRLHDLIEYHSDVSGDL